MNLELQKGSRSQVLAGLMLCIMAIFSIRLFYLQIIQHDFYINLANQEQVKRLTIPAKRGVIYALDDNNPVPLVLNQTVYTVFADPQIIKNDSKIIEVVKKIAGGNARSDLKALLSKKESRYQILATQVSRTQAELIKKENLSGVGFQEQTKRVYTENSLASQLLGFVNYDGIGKYGVESFLNERLTGKAGVLQSVTDVRNVPLTIGNNNIKKPAQDGENIVLSVDRNIQSRVEQALVDGISRAGATAASAIVMDPQSGKVLAMANYPTYNVSEYHKVQDVGLFNNAVISAPYEPGSDIKTLTMAIGIDKNVVSPNATYNNMDYIKVDDRTITNAVLGQTGEITFQHAMNYSLNTGFVTVAQRLGDGISITRGARDIMYDYYYNKFRLGQKTGIEIDGEARGTIIPPTEAEGNAVRYSNMAFGQGMDLTMVQVASAFSAIVNGGKYYKPTVVAGLVDGSGKYIPKKVSAPVQILAQSTADQVREMTHNVRNAFYEYYDPPGYYVGGKTGTSQIQTGGKYNEDETVGTYLGFGGSETQSNYVIMVQVSGTGKNLNGARDAGPIFTDISTWMLNYLKIQPKG